MRQSIEIEVQDIDHLGLIAGIIDDIGIVDLVDQELGTHTRLVSKCRTSSEGNDHKLHGVSYGPTLLI